MKNAVKFMIISALGFSLMQLCVKYLQHLPTVEIVFFRSVVSIVLSVSMIIKLKISPWGNQKKYLILRGLFGMTALTLFFYTLQNLPIATAITIQYLSPIFTAIIAIFVLGERMKRVQWLFFLLAFIGVVMLKGFDDRVSVFYFGLGILSAFFAGAA